MTKDQLKDFHKKLEDLEKKMYQADQESYKIQRMLRAIITDLETKGEV